jgi:hypothetical protein
MEFQWKRATLSTVADTHKLKDLGYELSGSQREDVFTVATCSPGDVAWRRVVQ